MDEFKSGQLFLCLFLFARFRSVFFYDNSLLEFLWLNIKKDILEN